MNVIISHNLRHYMDILPKSSGISLSELKDANLLNLSKALNKDDMRSLAVELNMEPKLDIALSNHPNDINTVAHNVLRTWRDTQEKQTCSL